MSAAATPTPDGPPVSEQRQPSNQLPRQQSETALPREDSAAVDFAGDIDTARSSDVVRDASIDKSHKVFLYVSIPMTVIAGVLALAMYLSHNVQAVIASHSVAGFCAACATILTVFLIYCHLSTYTSPLQQRYICRILLMVPIYAIDSFVALMAYRYGNILALIRDTYEAYVIYQFYHLLMEYLGGEDQLLAMWANQHKGSEPEMEHLFPMNFCLKPLKLNRQTLRIWLFCLVQYMILNPLLTVITLPLYFAGCYHEGAFVPHDSYPYLAGVRFWSVTFAFTSLVYFFFATKQFLENHQPMPKFAAIKTVVFLSFWQSVLLAGLNHFGIIPHSDLWTSDEVATGLQNFIVCVEMYLVALAHRFIFSDDAYVPPTGRQPLQQWVVLHVLSISDVIDNTADILGLSPKNTSKETPFLADEGVPAA